MANNQLRLDILNLIIKPTLLEIGLDRPNSAALVHGTFLVETNYDALIQHPVTHIGGNGLGQCEQLTYNDNIKWLYNFHNKGLLALILKSCRISEIPPDVSVLQWNLKLAVCICRVHYVRVKAPIPSDAKGMSNYHKIWYNSINGKADPIKNTPLFEQAIREANG